MIMFPPCMLIVGTIMVLPDRCIRGLSINSHIRIHDYDVQLLNTIDSSRVSYRSPNQHWESLISPSPDFEHKNMYNSIGTIVLRTHIVKSFDKYMNILPLRNLWCTLFFGNLSTENNHLHLHFSLTEEIA